MDPRVICILSILNLLLLKVSLVSPRMSKKLYPPQKEDLPFIKCDVCQRGIKYLYRKAKSMREESTTRKVVKFAKLLNTLIKLFYEFYLMK